MKVAVTAQGEDLQSLVDPRFGRARCFIVVDLETGQWEVVDNRGDLDLAQGAGIQAARKIAERQVQFLITGHCGPKAFRTLSAAGIEVVLGAEGTVAEVLERFGRGELKAAPAPDVDSHWA
jgi:predicted Fe-Mo cluster-binding NifX family protein